MHIVAGSNLHRQWFSDDLIISRFQTLKSDNSYHNFSAVELLQVCWFYNIVKSKNSFYIIGFTNTEENVRKIELPEDWNPSDVFVAGNDYKLLVVNKYLCKILVLNLEQNTEIKCMNLNVECPEESSVKKRKSEDKIVKVSLFNNSILFLTETGNVYCGFLPSLIDTTHCTGKVTDVCCGYEHYILLTDAGCVYTWGNGRRLQLGHGDVNNLETPTEIEALAGLKIDKISAGGWHSLALSEFGDLYAWGWNVDGQLGIKTNEKKSYSLPALVDIFDGDTVIDENVKDMACGSKFSTILLEDNSVWTSGNNKYGQLGLPTDIECIIGFQKAYRCSGNPKLMCGPWSTVIICQ